MESSEVSTAAGIFFNKNFLDFLGIAIVAPVIASIIAIITARLGVTGRIRRLELAEKRIEVITSLLSKSDIDDDIRAQLRAQMNDITADIISEYGGTTDEGARRPELQRPQHAPTKWAELSLWKRYLFPPFTKSILSWVCGIFYYYSLLSVAVMALGFTLVVADGTAVEDDYIFALVLFPLAVLFLFIPRFGMRHAYNNAYAGQLERQRVSDHTLTGQRQTV
ncbi:hypothetical protein [Roseobacter sinensis]|uniref:Uncharacterized protein n=1 Tax=Roseobacter sinensis TaxID=2931391 RepID=A0ABT3BD75_9RHOB|nr:hypothetical protein [Roseobacter sp. WL0113]MCV3271512.1 hypothetical protein [Roseobacter sp. WL0113]